MHAASEADRVATGCVHRDANVVDRLRTWETAVVVERLENRYATGFTSQRPWVLPGLVLLCVGAPRNAVDIVSPVLDLSFDTRLARYPELEVRREESIRLLEALTWKQALPPVFPVMVCVLGGTGTGKSTLFNSLVGRSISAVGMRRPCTVRAVVFTHERWQSLLSGCPCLESDGVEAATVVPHTDPAIEYLILIDTPDFDSVELSNRRICEYFLIVSDVVVFVTSQEKYADMAGREVLDRTVQWGKNIVFVMNKVASDQAYDDLAEKLEDLGHPFPPLKVERFDTPVERISDLRGREGFRELMSVGNEPDASVIRERELEGLLKKGTEAVEALDESAEQEARRIDDVNEKIGKILQSVSREMEERLDIVVSRDVEEQIRGRLGQLLRKYDILFVPRMMVKNTLRKVFHSVASVFSPGTTLFGTEEDGKSLLQEDLHQAREAARLEPVEMAVAKLNLGVAELLSSDSSLEDLREVARTCVPRWDAEKIRSLYDDEFPGMEHLLEVELERFRHGLSRSDEVKLYGSYTVWALLLITAEITVGGGFTLLDALLNTVIVPFIPKWMINLKVIDLLREIGERLDREHRLVLKGIVERQTHLYVQEFSNLIPDREQMARLRNLKRELTARSAS